MSQTIMVFGAHSDDQVLGPGGAMAKYAKEGHDILTVVFTYGELSHPWIKKRITVDIREKESNEADKVVGGKGVLFLGISESSFLEETESDWVRSKIKQMIQEHKPCRVFTHAKDDPHPAHRAVFKVVTASLDELKYKCPTYSFEIWNPLKFTERDTPRMYVDVTDTFATKIKSIKCFKSQWVTMIFLLWSIYSRAMLDGFDSNCKYAEKFYRVR